MIIGIGLGASLGGIWGQADEEAEPVIRVMFGAMIGSIAGFTVGALIERDDWRSVTLAGK